MIAARVAGVDGVMVAHRVTWLWVLPVPLRDALLDPPHQDGGGVHPFHVDRLIGGEQRDPGVGKLAFQLERVERVPAGAFDVLTDHGGEPGLGEAASASRSARPPSRGMPTSKRSCAEPWPRCSMSRPPDSTSQNQAAINDPGGAFSCTERTCRRSDDTGSWTTRVEVRPRNASGNGAAPCRSWLGAWATMSKPP